MLRTIQRMKFFLRTGFGESPGFMTAVIGEIIHGLCQGNTTSLGGWSVISAILLAVYKRLKHGCNYHSPIRRRRMKSAGVWFVDDVDLTTMNNLLTSSETWREVQSATTDWSCILNGNGGTLKGEKCFGYLVDYSWSADGSWHYAPVPNFDLRITLPDGTTESIALLDPAEARVTLHIATCPNGDDSHHVSVPGTARDKWKSIRTQAETWVTRLCNRRLPPQHAWISYRLQLWAGIRYGLGVLSLSISEMGEITKNFAYRALLSKLGVNRHIQTGWRYLHSSFGGIGLLDYLATESVISRLNMFIQHWDNPAPIGEALRSSMECLQLEIGCVGNPLNEPFDFMGHRTHIAGSGPFGSV